MKGILQLSQIKRKTSPCPADILLLIEATVYTQVLCLRLSIFSPLNPPILGDFEILVPPILGVRGLLREGLAKFYYLCVQRSLIKERERFLQGEKARVRCISYF